MINFIARLAWIASLLALPLLINSCGGDETVQETAVTNDAPPTAPSGPNPPAGGTPAGNSSGKNSNDSDDDDKNDSDDNDEEDKDDND